MAHEVLTATTEVVITQAPFNEDLQGYEYTEPAEERLVCLLGLENTSKEIVK